MPTDWSTRFKRENAVGRNIDLCPLRGNVSWEKRKCFKGDYVPYCLLCAFYDLIQLSEGCVRHYNVRYVYKYIKKSGLPFVYALDSVFLDYLSHYIDLFLWIVRRTLSVLHHHLLTCKWAKLDRIRNVMFVVKENIKLQYKFHDSFI